MVDMFVATPSPTGTPRPSGASGGPRTGAGRPGGSREGGSRERRAERTVYVLRSGSSHPEPVQIKTGISDGVTTEVMEGLKEGDLVVTGSVGGAAPAPAATNPFGGGPRRF